MVDNDPLDDLPTTSDSTDTSIVVVPTVNKPNSGHEDAAGGDADSSGADNGSTFCCSSFLFDFCYCVHCCLLFLLFCLLYRVKILICCFLSVRSVFRLWPFFFFILTSSFYFSLSLFCGSYTSQRFDVNRHSRSR